MRARVKLEGCQKFGLIDATAVRAVRGVRLAIATTGGIAGDESNQLFKRRIQQARPEHSGRQRRECVEQVRPVRHDAHAVWDESHSRLYTREQSFYGRIVLGKRRRNPLCHRSLRFKDWRRDCAPPIAPGECSAAGSRKQRDSTYRQSLRCKGAWPRSNLLPDRAALCATSTR